MTLLTTELVHSGTANNGTGTAWDCYMLEMLTTGLVHSGTANNGTGI